MLDLTADIIDVRDIIERIEELEGELEEAHEQGQFMSDFDDWITNTRDNSRPVYAALGDEQGKEVVAGCEELFKLRELMDKLRGYGGRRHWRGDWYPLTLIRDSYFTDYARELLEDCGVLPKDLPSYIEIDWEATACNIQQDYASVKVDGDTYWYR